MNIQQSLTDLRQRFDVVSTIDLDRWYDCDDLYNKIVWLRRQIEQAYRPVYEPNQRVVFTLTRGDEYYEDNSNPGLIATNLLSLIREIDITDCFVVLITDDAVLKAAVDRYQQSNDRSITVDLVENQRLNSKNIVTRTTKKVYDYGNIEPVKVPLQSLSRPHQKLLTENSSFCMYPWIHLHVYPTGEAWPCCQAEWKSGSLGNSKKQPLSEIWNSDRMKQLRKNMLNGVPDELCQRCYEQEDSGFLSGRLSANKHHGHHIDRVDQTKSDGTYETFAMTYWDLRFSNLCNLRCRSCGHIFSSNWFQDQVKIAGPEYKTNNQPLNYAGRWETDVWEQLVEHIDHVEQIYFAGGEPLLMEEHYRILDELERRGRFDVRLIYNTNFTEVSLKGRSVFDYWKRFDSVAVGASLDATGPKAEYIRKGTRWAQVEKNRRDMMEICPEVDFYISPTLSIMNAQHITQFHRDWTESGLIRAQDLNVNILQDPEHYRIDIAPRSLKQRLQDEFEHHLEWLRPQDPLSRATVGFESAVNFMCANDNSHLISKFWEKTRQLDQIRNEHWHDYLPELEALNEPTA